MIFGLIWYIWCISQNIKPLNLRLSYRYFRLKKYSISKKNALVRKVSPVLRLVKGYISFLLMFTNKLNSPSD